MLPRVCSVGEVDCAVDGTAAEREHLLLRESQGHLEMSKELCYAACMGTWMLRVCAGDQCAHRLLINHLRPRDQLIQIHYLFALLERLELFWIVSFKRGVPFIILGLYNAML